ncbi:MAG: addiction module protein [Vicinamibacterales bacterium]
MAHPKIDFSHLSPRERLELIGELWDSLSDDAFEITPELAAELDRRLDEMRQNPDAGRPWEEVREDLRRRLA